MTGTHPAGFAAGASRDDGGAVVVSVIGKFLSVVTTPTFAVMAALSSVLG